jgi:hypothetical protein
MRDVHNACIGRDIQDYGFAQRDGVVRRAEVSDEHNRWLLYTRLRSGIALRSRFSARRSEQSKYGKRKNKKAGTP